MLRFFVFAEWLLELLKLHFLWIVYIFRGGIIAGIFPSTAAVYATSRHWQLKREDRSISELFKQYYRENFKKSNLLGWIILIISCMVVFNFLYVPIYTENIRLVMYSLISFLALLLIIIWIYMFPVIVHYELSISGLFAIILKSGFVSLSGLILQLFFWGIFLSLIYQLPALFVLFGVVPLGLTQMAVSLNVFDKIS